MSTVIDLVKSKRAVREFTDQPLAPDLIRQILDAGRLAGSAKNMQPWHFVAIERKETLVELSRCGQFAVHLAGASLGVALVTPDPVLRLTVPFDLGRAAQNMMLAAWAAGIGSEMATIYQPDRAREILGVPDGFTVPWCISFGYPAQPEPRPARKGGRRPPEDVFHFETW
jgi:nitroreductase